MRFGYWFRELTAKLIFGVVGNFMVGLLRKPQKVFVFYYIRYASCNMHAFIYMHISIENLCRLTWMKMLRCIRIRRRGVLWMLDSLLQTLSIFIWMFWTVQMRYSTLGICCVELNSDFNLFPPVKRFLLKYISFWAF